MRPKLCPWALVLVLAAAACGGNPAPPAPGPSPPAAPAAVSTPALARWTNAGTYTGAWPPEQSPPAVWGPVLSLPDYTSPDGYRYTESAQLGPALHYQIPHPGFGCSSSYTGSEDLPPGQYAVPIRLSVTNLLAQQAPVDGIVFGTERLPFAGSQDVISAARGTPWLGQPSSDWTSAEGCDEQVSVILPPHGTAYIYGLIGPASLAQLQQADVIITQPPVFPISSAPAYSRRPLDRLVPGGVLPGN